jgi:tRNA pseudouridine38-40 synthase
MCLSTVPKKIMRNIRLKIEYDGTNYKGWQIQNKSKASAKNPNTIQQTIQTVLSRILRENIKLIGSGRTDAGVHASGQVANFKTKSKMPVSQILRALNGLLPKDIVVVTVKEVSSRFHSRFDAILKTYRYQILNREYPTVFKRLYQWNISYKLDFELMQTAANLLTGKKDFRSFQASDKKKRSSVRKIKKISIKKQGDVINIDIEADGFLYNMVRNIVGTLVEIGRGKIKPEDIKEITDAKDRKAAGPTAPAKGLCLVKVTYK